VIQTHLCAAGDPLSPAVEEREMETTLPIGYLGSHGTLYCSRVCAAKRGEPDAGAVDEQEYDELCESGRLAADLVCPACGSDYTVIWPGRERD
jgi:hypothetical protein